MQAQTSPTADILVVDDNPANVVAIEAALGELGARVKRAHSGGEALRILLERDFALILLDVKMPTMDGFETARMIRARKRSAHTPIIFITAHGRDDRQVHAAYALGAVDFLFKPIVPEVLRAKASVFVELQSRTAEVARQAELIREHERREHERSLSEERSRWEAEAMLRQMEQLAEADRRKDQFLALLGHELRNPLAPIMAGLELLRQKFAAPSPQIDAHALRARDIIERQSQHLARLVDDLLDISRISSGKIELRKARVELRELVELALQTSQPILDERSHELQVELPSAPLWVCGDAVRLVQVLANLLNNAARYTPDGGVISLRGERRAERVEIKVRDNGRGISSEFMSRVFDAFSQEQTQPGSGLGLGLSVVRQLVLMHDGAVTVSSDGPGLGSEFTVHLPLDLAPPPTASAAESALDVAAAEPALDVAAAEPALDVAAACRSLSIVLIDDSEDIRELMADLFRGWGHQVEVAADGESGSALALRKRPDIAFVDIGLPRLDGYGVAEQLRAQLSRERLRLVAMTGFGQESDKRRALDAGFDLHIVKPASIEALRRALVF